jgi:radical SAM protein with 4Fe4S-binding SPASM domain
MKLPVNNINISGQTQPHFTVQFHFTEICNLRCIHCYDSTAQNSDQSLDRLCRIIDRSLPVIVKEWGMPVNLSLTGGEPFASRNLFPLLSYIQDKYRETEVEIKILSNGTLITGDHVQALKSSFPMVKEVQISLDGVRQETHERIRGAGTHRKALRACELLVRHGIHVAAHMVVTTVNYPEAFDLTELAKNHGLSRLTVTRLVPIGRGQELGKFEITASQVRQLYNKLNHDADILDSSSQPLRIARYRCDWPVLYTPPEYKIEDLRYPFMRNGGSCAVGSHMITVMSDGTALACRRLPLPLGNVLEEDLRSIWNHPVLWKIRLRHRYIKEKCERCEFMQDENLRFSCGGGGALCINYGHYGNAFRPDVGCSYEPGAVTSRTG